MSNPATSQLGYLTFANNMACSGAQRTCTNTSVLNTSTFSSIPGGVAGGTPLVVFDDSPEQIALVFSPATNFMAASHVYTTGVMQMGVMGSITSLPAGFAVEFVASAGFGVTDSMLQWGRSLLRRFGKEPMTVPGDGRDRTVDELSYYTDNGARYYYCTEENKTYEQTIIDIVDHARAVDIPYRAVQLDSWWYYKDPLTNGVTNWSAVPSVFPGGLEGVAQGVRLPFIAHNRYWDSQNIYARQNGGDYDFLVEGTYALPLEERFWVDLLQNASTKNVAVYEQDWLHVQLLNTPSLMANATLARQWLLQMGRGAEAAEVTIQYCMHFPRHALQSVEIPSVTQIRASDDYRPGTDQWSLGVSSLLFHALGLAPWKDDAWTSTAKQDCPSGTHTYNQDTEPAPELQMMVSALSTGPVGPSDLIGLEGRSNILATCTADGVILKPSAPATAIDLTFHQRAFGTGGPTGELWSTFSRVTDMEFKHILCAWIDLPFDVYPSMTKSERRGPRSADNTTLYAFRFSAVSGPSLPAPFTESSPVHCAANDKTSPQLWHASPLLPSGHVFLGETDKYVALSPLRFSGFEAGPSGFSVTIKGADGETVSLAVYDTKTSKTTTTVCTLPASGAAAFAVQGSTSVCLQ